MTADLFKLVKTINIYEIAQRYLPGELRRQGSRWLARCPFHGDKDPSLVVFRNGWRCFGCGERGDGVDLVARLYNMRPLDAARMIAADFNMPIPSACRASRQVYFQAKARRELEGRFKQAENKAYRKLASIYRALNHEIVKITTIDDLEQMGDLYHIEVILKHALETLRTGTAKERAVILSDSRLKRVIR